MKILVVGGGMYVIGRGTNTFGTIMPALFEAKRQGLIDSLAVATTKAESADYVRNRADDLASRMDIETKIKVFPERGQDSKAYLTACERFKPEAAVIAVPDHLHATITVSLLERGIHCLVVKPLAPTVEEAQRMVEAARKARVVAEVEFHKRLDESNLLLRDAILNGRLGKLLYVVVEYSQRKQVPRDYFRLWAEKTSIFQYLGVHYVDLIQFVTGFLPLRVTAWGQKCYLKEKGIDTWDAIQAVVEWSDADGEVFTSTILTNWIDPDETSAMSDQRINVVGTKGRFQADQKNRGVQVVLDEKGVEDVNPYFSSSWIDHSQNRLKFHGYGINSVLQFLSDVHNYRDGSVTLENLERSRPTFQQCMVSTAVIEATHRSLKEKSEPVEVSLPGKK